MAKITSQAESFPQGIFETSSTQQIDLGAKASTADGREYRYVKAGGTELVAGQVQDGPATVANHTNLATNVAAVGATQITVTLGATAVTANQYSNGYVVVNDVAGQGYTYSIKSHPAANASAAVVITLEDSSPVQEALTIASQVTLVANQYNGVVVHATAEAGVPVGVAVVDIAANEYGWVQTRGPVSALCGFATGIGLSVAASDTVAGAYETGDGILPVIGYAIAAGVATEYNPIFLTID